MQQLPMIYFSSDAHSYFQALLKYWNNQEGLNKLLLEDQNTTLLDCVCLSSKKSLFSSSCASFCSVLRWLLVLHGNLAASRNNAILLNFANEALLFHREIKWNIFQKLISYIAGRRWRHKLKCDCCLVTNRTFKIQFLWIKKIINIFFHKIEGWFFPTYY